MTEHQTKDGQPIDVSLSLSPMTDAGSVIGAAGIGRNLRAQKRAEDALRESEASFRLLFADNPHPMWVYDLETLQFLEVNEAAVTHYGYSRDEFLGMRITDIRPAEDIPRLMEDLTKPRGDLDLGHDWRHRLKDGRIIDVEISSHTLSFVGRPAALVLAKDITERKRAEEALRESEERLARIVETNANGIVLADLEDRITFANRAARQILGLLQKRSAPQTYDELGWKVTTLDGKPYPVEDRPAARVIRTGRPAYGIELVLEGADGRRAILSVNAAPLHDAHGTIVGAVNTFSDITEQKRAEEELRQHAAQRTALADLGQQALGGTDLSALMDQAVRLLARTLDAELCAVLELLPADQPEGTAGACDTPLRLRSGVGWKKGLVGHATVGAGPDSQAAYTMLSEWPVIVDDLQRETRFTSPALLQEHGAVSGMSVVIPGHDGPFGVLEVHSRRQDSFTQENAHFLQAAAHILGMAVERKRAEEERVRLIAREEAALARARAEETIRLIIRASPVPILSLDRTGCVTSWNPAVERALGWTEHEVLGRVPPTVAQEDHQSESHRLIERVLGGELVTGVEMRRPRKDGSVVDLHIAAAPLRDENGNINGLMAVLTDVTERKRLEDEIRRKNAELEEQYAQIQRVSQAKSDFLANMSHEIRTPLYAVMGFAELLHERKAGPLTDEQHEYLGDILTSSQHLLQILNDVLDLSKVEAGRLDFHPEPVDLNMVVVETCELMHALAADKGISIGVEVDPTLDLLLVDPARLRQVLLNYLSNAVKFTPKGGSIAVRGFGDGEDMFRIEVSDTGIGISPEDVVRLFVEFQQLDAGAAKKHRGTGLGLALTKRIVEAQGGTVGVESEPGQGSTFFAILPRRTALPRA